MCLLNRFNKQITIQFNMEFLFMPVAVPVYYLDISILRFKIET